MALLDLLGLVERQVVAPAGIGSAEVFGVPTLLAGQIISPIAITSSEAFGADTLSFVIYPTGIASAEAFGGAKLSFTLYVSAIASAESFGNATVATSGPQTVSPTGIGSGEAFGNAIFLSVSGNALGPWWVKRPQFNFKKVPPWRLKQALSQAGAVPSAESFGLAECEEIIPEPLFQEIAASLRIAITPQILAPRGIRSKQRSGKPKLKPRNTLGIQAIATEESLGSAAVIPEQFVFAAAIASRQALPLPRVALDADYLAKMCDEQFLLEGTDDLIASEEEALLTI